MPGALLGPPGALTLCEETWPWLEGLRRNFLDIHLALQQPDTPPTLTHFHPSFSGLDPISGHFIRLRCQNRANLESRESRQLPTYGDLPNTIKTENVPTCSQRLKPQAKLFIPPLRYRRLCPRKSFSKLQSILRDNYRMSDVGHIPQSKVRW